MVQFECSWFIFLPSYQIFQLIRKLPFLVFQRRSAPRRAVCNLSKNAFKFKGSVTWKVLLPRNVFYCIEPPIEENKPPVHDRLGPDCNQHKNAQLVRRLNKLEQTTSQLHHRINAQQKKINYLNGQLHYHWRGNRPRRNYQGQWGKTNNTQTKTPNDPPHPQI